MLRRSAALPALGLALALVTPAAAGPADLCKHSLAAASASMDAARARVKSAGRGDESCTAYRRHFLEVVKARAVTAMCKSGSERAQDLGRLDGTVEDLNGIIAARCG